MSQDPFGPYGQPPPPGSPDPYAGNPQAAAPSPFDPPAAAPTEPYSSPPPAAPYGSPTQPYGGPQPYGAGAPPPGGSPPYGGPQPYGAGYPHQPPGQPPPGQPPAAGWPAPGWPAPPPPRQRTGLVLGLVAGGLALVLCLGGVAFVGFRVLGDVDGGGTLVADPPGATADPSGGDPFAGTPAGSFAEGEAGIALPPAPAALGDFTAAEVADALEQVRAAMIATRIDPTMLVEHDPDEFLALMSVSNRQFLRQDFEAGSFGYFASQVADGAALAVPTPRVDGQITYEATVDSGGVRVVEVVTSFVWAYAFEVPGGDPQLDGIVVVRDELVWHLPHEQDVSQESTGLWLWEGEAYAWGIDCEAFDFGLLAPQTEVLTGFDDATDEGRVFDPQGPLDIPSTC